MKRIPIVIHGLMGILPFISAGTRDIDKLITKLASAACRDFLQSDWKSAWEYIQDMRHNHGRIEVIIIGHSMGCYRAIQIAEKCHSAGIKVAYIAAIDATAINRLFRMKPMVVPSNVVKVDEFWAYFGAPAMARNDETGNRGGKFIYPEKWGTPHEILKYKTGHIAIASRDDVVKQIVDTVKELV